MNMNSMYKVKLERRFSYNNIGGMDKFWSSEEKFLTSFERIKTSLFKIKSTCNELTKFLYLHQNGEEYHIPNTEYTMNFREISQLDGYPCFMITSDHDLSRMFNTFELAMKNNGVASSVGILHKFNSVDIKVLPPGMPYKIEDGEEDKAILLDLSDLEFLAKNLKLGYTINLKILSAIDEDGNEFEYNDDVKDFIKNIHRETRMKKLLDKKNNDI